MELYVIIATGWLYFIFEEDAFDLAYGKISNSITVSSVGVMWNLHTCSDYRIFGVNDEQ